MRSCYPWNKHSTHHLQTHDATESKYLYKCTLRMIFKYIAKAFNSTNGAQNGSGKLNKALYTFFL